MRPIRKESRTAAAGPSRARSGSGTRVARRADALGFRDLWVTENTLDHVFCLDSMAALTYAAAVTTRIRLGVSVMVLPLMRATLPAPSCFSLIE